MRLFIAINFNDEIKNNLLGNINKLKTYADKGNFTRAENLHLTLMFIGETTKLSDVHKAVDSITADSFDLTVGGMGKFSRKGGDIYWVGVDKNNTLTDIYNQLCINLRNAGFDIENREYKPHITLGREIILGNKPDFDVPEMNMNVSKISLMKSERIKGRLIYTEIYSKSLES